MMEYLGVIVVLLFFLLVFLRVPIAIALIFPPVIYIVAEGIPLTILARRVTYSLDSFTLLAIPLFIYVGTLLNRSGITDKIFDFANDLIGYLTGGLAQVNIIGSLIFSGMSGAALADIGGIGRMMIHAMSNNGYERDYSAALTSASATVGPIFPPSIPLIIFGVVGQVSVLSLFLAGIVPAILATVLLMAMTFYLSRTRDFPKTGQPPTVARIAKSFVTALPALLTPAILIGGMLSGFFGPTEAAAVTVLYVLAINIFIYGNRTAEYIFEASIEAVETTSTILFIVAGAAMYSWIISIENIPTLVGNMLFSLSTDPLVILLVINVFLLIIGMFVETIAAILMLTPILLPPLVELGVDPVHFGVIMVFNLMIGLLTPPLGLSIYLSSDIAEVKSERVMRKVAPYYIPLALSLLLITYLPSLSLWILD